MRNTVPVSSFASPPKAVRRGFRALRCSRATGRKDTLATETDSKTELQSLAADVVARALQAGATDAEAVGFESEEFSVNIRLGQVEQLTESGSGALGLRVFFAANEGQRTASTSTSDLSADGITRLITGAVELAKV